MNREVRGEYEREGGVEIGLKRKGERGNNKMRK